MSKEQIYVLETSSRLRPSDIMMTSIRSLTAGTRYCSTEYDVLQGSSPAIPAPVTPLHMAKGSSYSPPVQLFVEETDDEGEDCTATHKATNKEARQHEVFTSKSGDIGETSSHSSVQSPPCQMENSCGKVRSQETTAKHLTEREDKQQRHMKRIKYSVWDGVLVKNVHALPYDIDGNCIYQLPYSKNDRLASSRDGRPWRI